MMISKTLKQSAQQFFEELETLIPPTYQMLDVTSDQVKTDRMPQEVREGLSKPQGKTLPCTYLYDETGSLLYEQITHTADYYPTRTEAEILRAIAPSLAKHFRQESEQLPDIVELGSGSSAKTRILFDAWQNYQQALTYIPIDVSPTMLRESAQDLARSYRYLRILGIAGEYEEALSLLPPSFQERLFLFLGGTIGNFSPEAQQAFFTQLTRQMGKNATLLLGFDRRPHRNKPAELIERAYNDREGVTEQFNLNILSHINSRLQANFDITQWQHRALYNSEAHQIEMYLESQCNQTVAIDALNCTVPFKKGERILTELSRKFDPEELSRWFEQRGYTCLQQWSDPQERFNMMLLKVN